MNIFLLKIIKHGNTSSYRTWASAESPCLVDSPGWGNHFHNFPPASKNSYRQASTYDLSQNGYIRNDAEVFLCPPHREPKPCNNLIENKKYVIFQGEFPEFLKVSIHRENRTHIPKNGFNYHCSHIVLILFYEVSHCFNIVIRSL